MTTGLDTTNTVQALLFDLGGVLINIELAETFAIWSKYSAVPAEVLKQRFAIDESYRQHECGNISAQQYFASLRPSLGIDLTDAEFEQGWMAMLGVEVQGIEALLQQLQHLPLYLFSNTNAIHHEYWLKRYQAMLEVFDKQFVSSSLGQRKPDVDAFQSVADVIAVEPENILFFDDTLENINGAKKAGLQAVHVNSIATIPDTLLQHGLLPGSVSE